MVALKSVGTFKARMTCIFVYKVGVYDTSYVAKYMFVRHLGCKT